MFDIIFKTSRCFSKASTTAPSKPTPATLIENLPLTVKVSISLKFLALISWEVDLNQY